MTQSDSIISKLLVKCAKGKTSIEEKRQLEEWAFLSSGNQWWLELFSDPKWLRQQKRIYRKIDLNERSKTFWAKVAAREM